jgi:hypothetical protein
MFEGGILDTFKRSVDLLYRIILEAWNGIGLHNLEQDLEDISL